MVPVNVVLIKLFEVPLHMDLAISLYSLQCGLQPSSENLLIYASSYELNPRGIGPFPIRTHPLQNTVREIGASEKKAPLTEIWYVLHGRT